MNNLYDKAGCCICGADPGDMHLADCALHTDQAVCAQEHVCEGCDAHVFNITARSPYFPLCLECHIQKEIARAEATHPS